MSRQSVVLLLLLGLGTLGALVGCGSAPATVTGEVTVDGQRLEKGTISYIAAEGSEPPVTASIANGAYELRTMPGKKRVQISAPVLAEKRREHNGPDAPWVEVTRERLPERFNSNTELTFEVEAGNNTKNWNIDTRGRKP